MKLAITSQGENLDSALDPRFGRAKFFVVIDTETRSITVVSNDVNLNAAQGAGIQAGKKVVELGAKALITGNVGPKAFATLEAGNVEVYIGANGTIAEVLEQFKAGHLKALQSANVEGHW
jgi:predicted Fe-Mo cluster-binding NifX family protein